MSPQGLMSLAQGFDVEDQLREDLDGVGTSPAGVVADVINVMRADIKMLADVHDVDVEVGRMTEDRAAQVLSGLIQGDPELIELFNEMARKRQEIVVEALDDEEAIQEYIAGKKAVMNSADPETWEE
jgi:hypothetical protein